MTHLISSSDDAAAAIEQANSLDDLYPVFAARHFTAGWHKKRRSLWKEPATEFRPMRWRYSEAMLALDRAGKWIGTDLAERRNLLMFNPVGDNDYASTRTLVAAYQMIKPGEHARAHRHSPNALRLVVDAHPGLYTVVNGEKLPMNPGDVLLTPGGCWHSHYNEGTRSAYWIDVLDVPLVHLLEPMFYEEFPGGFQPTDSEPNESPFCYPLSWVVTQLEKDDDLGSAVRKLVLPSREHIPTMELSYLSFRAGASTDPDRTTVNRVFAVVRGSGKITVDNVQFEWQRGDVFVVPAWATWTVVAAEDSLLFQVSDEPVQRMLGFFRRADHP